MEHDANTAQRAVLKMLGFEAAIESYEWRGTAASLRGVDLFVRDEIFLMEGSYGESFKAVKKLKSIPSLERNV